MPRADILVKKESKGVDEGTRGLLHDVILRNFARLGITRIKSGAMPRKNSLTPNLTIPIICNKCELNCDVINLTKAKADNYRNKQHFICKSRRGIGSFGSSGPFRKPGITE